MKCGSVQSVSTIIFRDEKVGIVGTIINVCGVDDSVIVYFRVCYGPPIGFGMNDRYLLVKTIN
jgi:hypothetical protein